jgi:hypothetical protein
VRHFPRELLLAAGATCAVLPPAFLHFFGDRNVYGKKQESLSWSVIGDSRKTRTPKACVVTAECGRELVLLRRFKD